MNDRQEFFTQYRFEGLTFDEVRLKTGRKTAVKMPHEVSISTMFSRNVPLQIPIVSAAMDTVTEHRMAIAMAMLGGLGVIHKNLTPKQQADEVTRVKYHVNGLIDPPTCVRDSETINQILRMRKERGFEFHRFPVIDANDRLVGVLTKSDFELCEDQSRIARDVMTTKVITAPEGTDLDTAFALMHTHHVKFIPVVDDDRKVTGLYIFSDLKRLKSGPEQTSNVDSRGQLRVAAAVGTDDDTMDRVERLIKARADVIVIDTAHADSKPVFEVIEEILANYQGKIDIVAGNISEPESAVRLIEAGIDGLKIGQGPGSICTTRIIAGIGCPQVSAVYHCSLVADDIPVNADGGIRFTGDIPIAIGAGARSVMLGNMLAGTDEAPGDIVYKDGRPCKRYRGMGSLQAMAEHRGSRNRYHETSDDETYLVPEGVSGLTPYKGPVAKIINQCIGGLRKGMAYVGADSIEEMRMIAEFRKMNSAGQQESHVHDVVITEEPPNYPRSR